MPQAKDSGRGPICNILLSSMYSAVLQFPIEMSPHTLSVERRDRTISPILPKTTSMNSRELHC